MSLRNLLLTIFLFIFFCILGMTNVFSIHEKLEPGGEAGQESCFCGEIPIVPDARDTIANLIYCKGRGGCGADVGGSVVGFVPAVGSVKYVPKILELYKKTDGLIEQGLKNMDKMKSVDNAAGTVVQQTLKKADILAQKNVQDALARIKQGKNKFPGHDGEIYKNTSNILPEKPAGYYKEYTVETAGVPGRKGTERLVIGEGGEAYYTNTHYGDLPGEPFVQIQ